MEFSSIVELKNRLRTRHESLDGHFLNTARVRSAGAVSFSAARLAIGATPTGSRGQFHLALRPMDTSLATYALVDHALRLARSEIDLVEVGVISTTHPSGRRSDYADRFRPLIPGSSLGNDAVTAGTLGGFVRRADGDYILSNSHVLVRPVNPCGAAILQPGPSDGGRNPRDKVATLAWWQPLVTTGANQVDAALARMEPRITGAVRYPFGPLRGTWAGPPPLETRVWKVGRTTGITLGRIRAVALDGVSVNYGGTVYHFDDQIEIDGLHGAFSSGGDSGSLVVEEGGHAVGLLFAGSEQGGSNGAGRTYATPIATVLNLFDATLIC